jgi:hypothetical protein
VVSATTDCKPCATRATEGHYGLNNATHCRKCHRTWGGHREIHCVGCCAHFSTPTNCDRHKVGGICKDPATVVNRLGERILYQGARGVWRQPAGDLPR